MDRVKVSALVPAQLPSFVRENTDYQTFVQFLQAYYDYMEQSGVVIDLSTIRDIDLSVAGFIEHIKTEIAPKIPFSIADNRFKAQHLKDLYDAKGSSSSYKLLFRMLYGQETDIVYPSTQMLIPSDGRWIQPYSIFVTFDPFSKPTSTLVGKLVSIRTLGKTIQVFVERIEPVVILDGSGQNVISPNTYQLFISKSLPGSIEVGGFFSYIFEDIIFTGLVIPSVTKITIDSPGQGFKVGEIYPITTNTGIGVLVKINKVGTIGEIIDADLIGSGIGYASSFSSFLFADKFKIEVVPQLSTISYGGSTYVGEFYDTISGLVDFGFISTYDYTSSLDYWDNSFTGNVKSTFFDVSAANDIDTDLAAVVRIQTGAVVKYPGYFATNAGFLSDALYIQDSKYYQTFSYVVKLNKTLEDYGGILKTLLHPAGTALFGEFNLNDELAFDTEIESQIDDFDLVMFTDSVVVDDTVSINLYNAGDYLDLITVTVDGTPVTVDGVVVTAS